MQRVNAAERMEIKTKDNNNVFPEYSQICKKFRPNATSTPRKYKCSINDIASSKSPRHDTSQTDSYSSYIEQDSCFFSISYQYEELFEFLPVASSTLNIPLCLGQKYENRIQSDNEQKNGNNRTTKMTKKYHQFIATLKRRFRITKKKCLKKSFASRSSKDSSQSVCSKETQNSLPSRSLNRPVSQCRSVDRISRKWDDEEVPEQRYRRKACVRLDFGSKEHHVNKLPSDEPVQTFPIISRRNMSSDVVLLAVL